MGGTAPILNREVDFFVTELRSWLIKKSKLRSRPMTKKALSP
jgi:hypothetical protein